MTVISTLLISNGLYPQGCFAIIGVTVACGILWNHVSRLKQIVWTFAKSLEVRDTTVVFDPYSDDPMLSETLEIFNNLISLFHSITMDLETRKLYYDRILKVMTHEMGNSITPIMTICMDVKKHPERYSGKKLQEAMTLVDKRTRGINRFLKAYHNLTHLPPLRIEKVDSHDFMQWLSPLVDVELRIRNLPVSICHLNVSGSIPLYIDSDLMSQVMVNLLRNALDAVADIDNALVIITLSTSDSRPYIIVEDNGCGILPEMHDELFQPFVSTKTDGTGVGLYLSRQIVRQHGGDLRLISTPGKGTRTIINL